MPNSIEHLKLADVPPVTAGVGEIADFIVTLMQDRTEGLDGASAGLYERLGEVSLEELRRMLVFLQRQLQWFEHWNVEHLISARRLLQELRLRLGDTPFSPTSGINPFDLRQAEADLRDTQAEWNSASWQGCRMYVTRNPIKNGQREWMVVINRGNESLFSKDFTGEFDVLDSFVTRRTSHDAVLEFLRDHGFDNQTSC